MIVTEVAIFININLVRVYLSTFSNKKLIHLLHRFLIYFERNLFWIKLKLENTIN